MKSLVSILILVLFSLNSHAHSGRTNSEGCHNNRKTGGYHCHNGGRSSRVQASTAKKSKPAPKKTNSKLQQKGAVLNSIFRKAIKQKVGLEKAFNGIMDKAETKKYTVKTLRIEWGQFSRQFNKANRKLSEDPTLKLEGIPQTAEDMAKFEIVNYVGQIRNYWSVLDKRLQKGSITKEELDGVETMMSNAYLNVEACIKALNSGTNSLKNVALK